MSRSSESTVSTLDRGLRVLHALERYPRGARLTDVAHDTGLPPATATRLLSTLEASHFVSRDEAKRYHLGSALLRLGRAYRHESALETVVMPRLRQLARDTSDAASLYVLESPTIRVCAFRVDSTLPLREVVGVGDRLPAHRGAAGHVLRTFGRADPGPASREPPEFAEIRTRGYAVSIGERVPELASVAAPVFGQPRIDVGASATTDVTLVGAVTLSGLVTRFEGVALRQRIDLVLSVARDLTDALCAGPARHPLLEPVRPR